MKNVYIFLLYSLTNVAYSSDNFLECYLPIHSVQWRWRTTSSQIRSAITLNKLAQVKKALQTERYFSTRASHTHWSEDSETYANYAIRVKASVDIILYLLESEEICNLEQDNKERLLELLAEESKKSVDQCTYKTVLAVDKTSGSKARLEIPDRNSVKEEEIFKTACALLDCNTPIRTAALEKSKETPLENLFTANLFDGSGNTALTAILHKGSQYHAIENVRRLIGQGNYPVNRHRNLTPLHLACFSESYAMTKLLLDKGAHKSINQVCQGYTPLYIAVVYNNRDIARLLLKNGAAQSLTLATPHETPLSFAKKKGYSDMVTLLEKYQN